jgi:hypothetical protein
MWGGQPCTATLLPQSEVLIMEHMNLLDITIKYFNVIVFVLCVLFGMTSVFASWIAWREVHRKQNIIRSIVAAYNIAEDTLEKGRTPRGELQLDPAIVQTVFNSIQEILNAVYGEMTGKSIPARDERIHGSSRSSGAGSPRRVWKRKEESERINIDTGVPSLILEDKEHRQSVFPS